MNNPPAQFSGPELCALQAHQVVELLRRGEVSSEDLIDASLERINHVEPAVNAMPTVCAERAREFLSEWRTKGGIDSNAPGWLGGLPIGIKDLNAVAGVRTTFGTLGMANHIPDQSEPLVALLESRGGLVMGKTNTPEMGAGGNTFNAVFGATRNPWNTSLNAGGSSGGAAVSLATGEVWLSQGSDLAGSLRTPAAYCGVVGLRPSPGRAGGASAELAFHTEAVDGPMARSVTDCALFLDAMSGFDSRHPISFPAPTQPFQEAVRRANGRARIAYSSDLNGFAPVADEMNTALQNALVEVEKSGGVVEDACPELPQLDSTYQVLRAMLWAAGPGYQPESVQRHYKATLADNIQFGRDLKAEDIYAAQRARSVLFHNMHRFLEDFDVLACPTVGLMAGPLEEEYPKQIGGHRYANYIEWLRFSFLATTTALPAISLPVGFSEDGMPVGLQLIGPPRGEAKLLQVARCVEIAVGGPLQPIDPNVTHSPSHQPASP